MKTLGIVILILGILLTLGTGIRVITHKKVVDLGAVEITKEETTPIYWSPWTGLLLIAVGGSIVIYTRKKPIA